MAEELIQFGFEKKEGSIIKVIGVGGGGCNAVNHMFRSGIHDVNFIICNTDRQVLADSPVPVKVPLGASLTEGRGAGNKPEVGREAAIENIEDVRNALVTNTRMVFITAGMGGGTGTGGAPVIAELCRELGFLTIGIVTIPFRNEGKRRIHQAIEGIREMEKHVDSLLIINNERIREMYGDFPISQAFAKADDVLAIAAKGIAEIITVHEYINVDFADVETVMRQSGVAVMGTGMAEGPKRCIEAVEKALVSPLLNNSNIKGAKNILLNITSGHKKEVTMDEIGEITDYVQTKAGFNADLIWGTGIDTTLEEQIAVTVIATGFSTSSIPELLTGEKPTREVHLLEGNAAPSRGNPPVSTPRETEKHAPTAVKQPVFEFDLGSHQPRKSEYDMLYPGKQREESPREPRQKIDYSRLTDDDIDNLENIPAYIRKQMKSANAAGLRPQDYGNITVKPGPEKNISISGNNLYLHNNPD